MHPAGSVPVEGPPRADSCDHASLCGATSAGVVSVSKLVEIGFKKLAPGARPRQGPCGSAEIAAGSRGRDPMSPEAPHAPGRRRPAPPTETAMSPFGWTSNAAMAGYLAQPDRSRSAGHGRPERPDESVHRPAGRARSHLLGQGAERCASAPGAAPGGAPRSAPRADRRGARMRKRARSGLPARGGTSTQGPSMPRSLRRSEPSGDSAIACTAVRSDPIASAIDLRRPVGELDDSVKISSL